MSKGVRPAAFLFDLDGTLIDSEMLWARAICAWLRACGVPEESVSEEQVANLVFGHSWFDIHAALLKAFPTLPHHLPTEDAVPLRAHYEAVAADASALVIPTAVAFYRKVARLAPCAVVSGSPHDDVLAALALCGLTDVTRLVLGAEDYARGKPAPDGYLKAATLLDVDASECVVIEDSSAGVRSGKAAGMRVLGIDRNPVIRQDLSGAEWIVHDLSEFDVTAVFDTEK